MRLAIKLNTMSSVILWDAYKSKPANALELQNYAQLIREAYKTYPDAPEFQYRLVACALLALTPNEFWECEGIQQVCANYIQDQNHLSIARGRIASLLHLKFFCAYPEAIHPSWTIMGGHLLGTDYNATTGLVLSACQAVIEKGVKQNFSPIRQYLCEVEQDKTYRHTNKVYHYVLSLLNLMRQDIVSPEDLVDSFFAP